MILVAYAFGPTMGFINSYANALCSLVSQANLVVLFVQYIPYKCAQRAAIAFIPNFPLRFTVAEDWGIRLAFCFFTTTINIFGVVRSPITYL